MGLLKPAWKSENEKKALKAVDKITNQSELVNVARNAEKNSVRLVAVRRLTDQVALADISKNDKNEYVRYNAAERLTDKALAQEVFFDVGKHSANLRKCVVQRLTDPAAFAYFAKTYIHKDHYSEWDKKEEKEYRDMFVNKLNDVSFPQEVYADIVNNGQDFFIRNTALDRLSDQTALIEIAKHSKIGDFQITAADKLNDKRFAQTIYAEIVKSDQYYGYRCEAIKRITDPVVFSEIAKNEKDFEVRKGVVEQLLHHDFAQEVYADIAKNGIVDHGVGHPNYIDLVKNTDVCMAAVSRLTDQAALADIAKDITGDGWIRNTAVEKLTDKTVLDEIMNSSEKEFYTCLWKRTVRFLTADEEHMDTAVKTLTADLRETARKRLAELKS